MANLVDELARRKGDCEVSVEEDGSCRLVDLHADICSIDASLRRSVALRPCQPVAIYRTNNQFCFRWFLAVIRAGGIAVPLTLFSRSLKWAAFWPTAARTSSSPTKTSSNTTSGDRQALPVRTWIQADDEPNTLDGFVAATTPGRPFRLRPSILPRPSRYSIPPVPVVFPWARRCLAMPSSARAHPSSSISALRPANRSPRLVPPEPRELQSFPSHLDSRSRRPAPESHRQDAPAAPTGTIFRAVGLTPTFCCYCSAQNRWTIRKGAANGLHR